jgi:hypothetical protein
MISRSTTLKHPSGVELQTPLFVSSFSSKGFRFIKNKGKLKSEVVELVKLASEYLSETVLLSAYDLKYYLPSPKKLRQERFLPKLVFLDSGGYETIDDYDFSEAYKHPVIVKRWTPLHHKKILDSWPKYFPAVIISYDNGNEKRRTLQQQIKKATELFARHPDQLNNFLIKPNKKGEKLDVAEIVDHISLLNKFHIIGLAEKELGDSLIQRMNSIKTIRIALDKSCNKAPIHIFGNLDPLTSAMYFIAGAEIFDGLSWMRFGFFEGKAIYLQNIDALRARFHEKDYLNQRAILYENVIYMRSLQAEMRAFLSDFDEKKEEAFESFKYISSQLREVYQAMKSKAN